MVYARNQKWYDSDMQGVVSEKTGETNRDSDHQ